MPGEIPFYVTGEVVELLNSEIKIVKVQNGNLYHLRPSTPGIDFYSIEKGMLVKCEVTSVLTRILSATVIGRVLNEQ
jgi:hypothetical protein